MEFERVAEAFAAIEAKSGRLEMIERLAALFASAPREEIASLTYLCQGKLAPDYENLEVGLGEKLVIQALSRALGHSASAIEREFKKTGDLGLVGESFAAKKSQLSLFSSGLSVAKVYSNFARMARSAGGGSQDHKLKLLAELFNSATPLETRFLVRFPLGQLRLGIGDPAILDALADNHLAEFEAASKTLVAEIAQKYEGDEARRQLRMRLRTRLEAAYNIRPDLGFLASRLAAEGLAGLSSVSIEPGIPIRPTLAERLPSGEEIIKKLGRCAVEAKYDGFRFAIHKNGENVQIFSRRMENMSLAFPEIAAAVRDQLDCQTAICEGEALAVDTATGAFLSMQETIRRRRKHDVTAMAARFPLKLFLFDLLFVDGKSLLDEPFHARRARLEKIIRPGGVIEATESRILDDANELEAFFRDCIGRGLEGVMAKDLNAPYIAGARKFAWIKLKRSYRGELSDSIDVVVCGYYKGRGNRAAFGLGAVLGAVYNPDTEKFESVAKIGSGMTESELADLFTRVQPLVRTTRSTLVDSGIEADVWLEPVLVMEVRADDITESPVHTAARGHSTQGLALRFPRFIQLREDKNAEDATTSAEIERLFQQQKKLRRKPESPSSK